MDGLDRLDCLALGVAFVFLCLSDCQHAQG
jgi:hypothetical protein